MGATNICLPPSFRPHLSSQSLQKYPAPFSKSSRSGGCRSRFWRAAPCPRQGDIKENCHFVCPGNLSSRLTACRRSPLPVRLCSPNWRSLPNAAFRAFAFRRRTATWWRLPAFTTTFSPAAWTRKMVVRGYEISRMHPWVETGNRTAEAPVSGSAARFAPAGSALPIPIPLLRLARIRVQWARAP